MFKRLIPYITIAVLLLLLGIQCNRTTPTPEPKTITKVIEKPVPVTVTQTKDSLIYVYEKAPTPEAKKQVFEQATKQREYIEKVETKQASITVSSSVSGVLDNMIIEVEPKPVVERPSLYLGGYTTLPTQPNLPLSLGASLNLKHKKTIYSIGYDTNKTITVGVAFKLF